MKNIFGISQDSITNNYILVIEYNYFENKYCKQCGNEYSEYKWCKPCQVNHFEKNFTKWTSGNKQIDDLIQEKQLKIHYNDTDTVFEWIPYNQLNNIEKIGNSYSAVWKNGPLYY